MQSTTPLFRADVLLRVARTVLATCLFFLGLVAVAADSTEYAFNAVDGVPHELVVAVGNHGTIVHFPAGGFPRKVPSGTDRDLLDIHVAAPDFAIAVGRGIVLLWDGKAWRPIVVREDTVPYTQAWASPDHGLLLYGGAIDGAWSLCPFMPAAARQPFCRRFPAPLRAACGNGEELTLLLGNGEFHRVNDALINADGGFGPVFRPRASIDLRAAWLPEGACESSGRLPEPVAVDAGGRLVRFSGRQWWPAPAARHSE